MIFNCIVMFTNTRRLWPGFVLHSRKDKDVLITAHTPPLLIFVKRQCDHSSIGSLFYSSLVSVLIFDSWHHLHGVRGLNIQSEMKENNIFALSLIVVLPAWVLSCDSYVFADHEWMYSCFVCRLKCCENLHDWTLVRSSSWRGWWKPLLCLMLWL